MSEFSGLTFDWDDVSIDDGIVQAELEWLCGDRQPGTLLLVLSAT